MYQYITVLVSTVFLSQFPWPKIGLVVFSVTWWTTGCFSFPDFLICILPLISCYHCTLQPGNEWHNCYSDEHYLPTLFNVSTQKLLNNVSLILHYSSVMPYCYRPRRWLIQPEFQTGRWHALIGLKESGTLKFTGPWTQALSCLRA